MHTDTDSNGMPDPYPDPDGRKDRAVGSDSMSRTERRARARTGRRSRTRTASGAPRHQRTLLVPLLAVLATLIVVAGVMYAFARVGAPAPALPSSTDTAAVPVDPVPSGDGTTSPDASASLTASAAIESSTVVEVEIPDLVGKSLAAAEALAQAAGFKTQTRIADSPVPGVPADQVVAQFPGAGTRAHPGERIVITYQPRTSAQTAAPTGVQRVVVIDAGHQAKADLSLEPIGPGSATTKPKVAGGATGVSTRIPEYRQTLAVAFKLRDRLQARGIKVVMVRTSDDVNIANSQRAKIGNAAGAALVVRVHFDSNSKNTVSGISTLYPSGNSWVKAIEGPSKRAASLVQSALIRATGAKDRGIFGRADMSGFNYSTRPTIIVEGGFMSNRDEDLLIAKPDYQDKLAAGIENGVMSFLGP